MDREALKRLGFSEITYPDQHLIEDGVYMYKRVKVSAMPYMSEHAVDNDVIFGSDIAHIEVSPHNQIQMVILETDYIEEPVPLNSDQGMALLKDACGGSLDS